MKRIKFAVLVGAVLFTVVMIASAQEKKSCEYEGKTYPHREQVWQKEEGGVCTVCWDGAWVPRAGVKDAKFCKGKY